MAIVNSIATFSGVGAQVIQNIGAAVTATAVTIRVPAAGSISPAVTRGYWRFKIYNQTVAITITNVTISGQDGTNTAQVDNYAPIGGLAISATAYLDVTSDFILDTSAAGGGATGTLIFGGATFFNFLINSTGAGGTAAGDFEIVAVP